MNKNEEIMLRGAVRGVQSAIVFLFLFIGLLLSRPSPNHSEPQPAADSGSIPLEYRTEPTINATAFQNSQEPPQSPQTVGTDGGASDASEGTASDPDEILAVTVAPSDEPCDDCAEAE
jgi:hypothetical protein